MYKPHACELSELKEDFRNMERK